MLSSLRIALLLLLACTLVGCKVSVHSRAAETSANEVLSALLDAGIDADKVAIDEKSFDVEVAQSDLARALAVLRATGLPRETSENLGQLFKREGLVSTPVEERVRYIYGVSQELEKTLGRIDGVVQARVHIVIPANDPLSEIKRFSSASVFIKCRPPVDPTAMGPLVRTLVMRAIEGLEDDRVSVAFVTAEPTSATAGVRLVHWIGMKVPAESLLGLNVFLVLACSLPLLGGYWISQRKPGKGKPGKGRGAAQGHA